MISVCRLHAVTVFASWELSTLDMLDRWAHLLQWPKSVDYPEMMLIGDDHGNRS